MTAAGLGSHCRLTFPAAELIQDRGPTTPVGISATVHQDIGDLLPALLRPGSPQIAGLCNRLTGHGELQREAPGMQWRLGPRRPRLSRLGLHIVGVSEESSNN